MTRRLAPAATLAAAITLTLFWIMTILIHVPDVLVRPEPWPVVEIVEVERELTPPAPPPREIVRPEIEPAPAPPSTLDPSDSTPGIFAREVVTSKEGPFDPMMRLGGPSADGDALPIVRVPPVYPTRALASGVEGRVLVEFDVDPSGAVGSARVVVAEPPRIFDQAALEAIRQWRYSPRVVNGRAVERHGLRIAIPFVLQGD